MIDRLYLIVDHERVVRTVKRPPGCLRGQAVVRLDIEVEASAIRMPTLAQHVRVTDWREGVVPDGVVLRQDFIDDAQAALIREEVLGQMQALLESVGYQVTPPVPGMLALNRGPGD